MNHLVTYHTTTTTLDGHLEVTEGGYIQVLSVERIHPPSSSMTGAGADKDLLLWKYVLVVPVASS